MRMFFVILLLISFSAYSQTFNPAEYQKANRFENILTGMQIGGIATSVYSFTQKEVMGIVGGIVFAAGLESLKKKIKNKNIRLYYEPKYSELGICITIDTKRKKHGKL